MPHDVPLLIRFLAKCVLDVLPAVFASVIGGFLVTHYQAAHAVVAPGTGQAAPASAQMMQMVRDEHSLMVDFLKAQLAAEKRHLEEDAEARREAADDEPATVLTPPRRVAAAKAVTPHPRRPAAVMPQAPMVIAQADINETAEPAASGPGMLLARTLDLKDRVVTATQRVVAAIGSAASSTGRLVGASW